MADSPRSSQRLSDSAAQALRVLGGRSFERVIVEILNTFLEQDGIQVTLGTAKDLSGLIENQANVREIISYTRLPVKRRCTQTQLEDYPDSDLFAVVRPHHLGNPWRLLAIINCKESFHSRETEVAFYGLSVRTSSYIKYVCVTEDKDLQKTPPRSELGPSCGQATKARRLLESYTDRVYIAKHYSGPGDPALGADIETRRRQLDRRLQEAPVFDSPHLVGHTRYCHLVRPLDDLITDLKRWKEEIPPAE